VIQFIIDIVHRAVLAEIELLTHSTRLIAHFTEVSIWEVAIGADLKAFSLLFWDRILVHLGEQVGAHVRIACRAVRADLTACRAFLWAHVAQKVGGVIDRVSWTFVHADTLSIEQFLRDHNLLSRPVRFGLCFSNIIV